MVRRYKNGLERLQEYGKRGRKRPYTIKVTDKGCRGINLDFHKLFRITQFEMRGLISFMIQTKLFMYFIQLHLSTRGTETFSLVIVATIQDELYIFLPQIPEVEEILFFLTIFSDSVLMTKYRSIEFT